MFGLPSNADLVRPEIEDNTIINPAYADDIDPNDIRNSDENNNISDKYKNKTLYIFTAILLFLIVIASVSIRKSIKEKNNDGSNG